MLRVSLLICYNFIFILVSLDGWTRADNDDDVYENDGYSDIC